MTTPSDSVWSAGAMNRGWQMGEDMARFLFVVSRKKPELRDYLSRHFADEPEVLVTLDRRDGDRRRADLAADLDRRQSHRRWRPDNDETMSAVGAVMVPVEETDRRIRD